MKILKLFIIIVLMGVVISSCVKDSDEEILPPEIDILSPWFCDTIYFDEAVTYQFMITDVSDVGLGNFSMDVHNNFNHHSHGSHITCDMDPVKDPVNPYEEVWIESLPDEQSDYLLEMDITMPLLDSEGNEHDEGDYHFHIYVTNAEGYQVFTTLDVKLLKKVE